MARKRDEDLKRTMAAWLPGADQDEGDQAPADPAAERSEAAATPKPKAPATSSLDAAGGPLIRSTPATRTSSGRLLRRTIYTTPEEWAAVLAAAEAESRATGRYVSASDLVRRALRQALGLPDDGATS